MTDEMVPFGGSSAGTERLQKLVGDLLDWLQERDLTTPDAMTVCANALVAIHTHEISEGDRAAAARAIGRRFAEMSAIESVRQEA
jgi:hypothetical protein